jgi:putative ABC transport system permease protein
MQLTQDLLYSVRQMRKQPGFAIAVIATLGLTVGLSTTVFSVLDAVFIRPLPYHGADRIFAIRSYSPQGYTQPASYPEYLDWRRETKSFSALAGYSSFKNVNAELPSGPVSLHGVATSTNFFDVFGVKPAMGRVFEAGEEDAGRNNVAVLSDEVWRNLFDARADAIGSKIKLDGRLCNVIGVMPPGFRFPISRTDAVYFPLNMTDGQRTSRGSHWLPTVARLAPGASAQAAEQEFNAVLSRLGDAFPQSKGRRAKLVELAEFTVGNSKDALHLLFYAVLTLALLGCVNLAGLLLARGMRLQHEIAVRAALGANRWRIIRQILAESMVYSVAGGALGVALSYGLLHATRVLIVAALSRGAEAQINGPVLAASLAVAVLTSLLAGLWPAIRLSATSGSVTLRAGGRGGMDRGQHRVRGAFVSVQVALALVLLVTSGLVFQALARLQHADFGFDPANILAEEVSLSPAAYQGRDVMADFYTPLLEKARAIPGVLDAGLIQIIPIQNWGWNSDIRIVGQPAPPANQERLAEYRLVTPGYFRVFAIRLVKGRLLDDKLDTPKSAPVVVVNERFVERFIPAGLDPIGQAIGDSKKPPTIVGVVKNIRQSMLNPPLAETDYPISQIPAEFATQALSSMSLVLRTAGPPKAITQDLRRTFAAIEKTMPFRTPDSMEDVIATAVTLQRLENWLFGSFAALALVLALIGLYGLVSHEVELSRRDMGIRVAIGATRGRIFGLVYRRVAIMLAGGLVAGAAATYAARKLLATVVTIKPERDIAGLLALAGVFLLVSLGAAFLPARRAATVDPMSSLRAE